MNRTLSFHLARRRLGTLLALTFSLTALMRPTAFAQADPNAHAAHASHTNAPAVSAAQGNLTAQVADLQKKLGQLEAALRQKHAAISKQGQPAGSPGGMAAGSSMPMGAPKPAGGMSGMAGGSSGGGMGGGMMGMMDKMMGMMDKMMGGMGGPMPSAGPSMGGGASGGGMGGGMMDMDKMEMAGMMGMGGMGGMNGGAAMGGMTQSALPGFPGASHLYHIGATGFFLDHPQHIALTTEQQAALNHAKEQALLAKQSSDRQIEQAEQELWTLTAADQPDSAQIEAKVGEIEKLRQGERLTFIRAVGEAAKLLTDEQRKILTGFAPPAPAASAGGMAGGMSDM